LAACLNQSLFSLLICVSISLAYMLEMCQHFQVIPGYAVTTQHTQRHQEIHAGNIRSLDLHRFDRQSFLDRYIRKASSASYPPLALSSPVKRQHQNHSQEKGFKNPIFGKFVKGKEKSILRNDPHFCAYQQIHKAKPHPLLHPIWLSKQQNRKTASSKLNKSISQQNFSSTTTAHSSQKAKSN